MLPSYAYNPCLPSKSEICPVEGLTSRAVRDIQRQPVSKKRKEKKREEKKKKSEMQASPSLLCSERLACG